MSGSKAGRDEDVGRVTTNRQEDAAESWIIVTSIEIDPFPVEEDLIPRTCLSRTSGMTDCCQRVMGS
jgi:hypothetical protein